MAIQGGEESRELSQNEINLGDDFGPVSISVNGITLVIDENGNPTLIAPGDVKIITAYSTGGNVVAHVSGTVQIEAPDPEQNNEIATVTKQAYNIGDVLDDGWIVGPVSPETGNVMAVEPVAGALGGYQTWFAGEDHVKELLADGNNNAHQATDTELYAIYNEIVKAGNNDNAQFNTSGSFPYGRYWSSTPVPNPSDCATQVQYFDKDGVRSWYSKVYDGVRVRCVRDEPGLTLA